MLKQILLVILFATLCRADGFVIGWPASTGIAGEFDVSGATYYAVAPAGYSYSTDQTTNYSTRKYNTLAAAEAALAVSPTTPQVINIIGTWAAADTTSVTMDGVATTAANYTLVRALGTARHAGVYTGSDHYRLESTDDVILSINDEYVRIDGMVVNSTYTGTSQKQLIYLSTFDAGDIRISNNIILGSTSSTAANVGISIQDSDPTYRIWNNIIYGLTGTGAIGIYNGGGSATYYIYNNTVYGSPVGYQVAGTSTYYNNVALNCANGFSATPTTHSGNASSVAGDTDKNLTSAVATDYFESATNFHIKTAGTYASELIGQGTDIDQNTYIAVTTDIDGDTRSATAPDIGADED